jgi:hypothetical protein
VDSRTDLDAVARGEKLFSVRESNKGSPVHSLDIKKLKLTLRLVNRAPCHEETYGGAEVLLHHLDLGTR